MYRNLRTKILFPLLIVFLVCIGSAFAQQPESAPEQKNFRYSKNPESRVAAEAVTPIPTPASPITVSENPELERRSAANKTLEVAERAASAALSPTEIYQVGTGDVLFISLQNARSSDSKYFTVLNDGTIDYPLAGESVSVRGLTTDDIEALLRERIKVVQNPRLSVSVREYASHTITVLGLVEKAGVKFLQREAIPLFVVRAEAIVQPRANLVTIRRASTETESFDLSQANYEDVLVFPGDIVDFSYFTAQQTEVKVPPFFYIGGNINSVGQKDFYEGMTLTQAILASGGLKNSKGKTVIIRRQNDQGLLESEEFDLEKIKNGKVPDPQLQVGDTIEVGS